MAKILVLGGTRFVGRAIVEEAIKCGHVVCTFNRGKFREPPKGVQNNFIGDRSIGDYKSIEIYEWDYVIDACCYDPETLLETFKHIKTKKYVFISSGNALDNSDYGKKKRTCEKILEGCLNHLVFRPGYLVGEGDYTDRFYLKDNDYYLKHNNQFAESAFPVEKFARYVLNTIDDTGINNSWYLGRTKLFSFEDIQVHYHPYKHIIVPNFLRNVNVILDAFNVIQKTKIDNVNFATKCSEFTRENIVNYPNVNELLCKSKLNDYLCHIINPSLKLSPCIQAAVHHHKINEDGKVASLGLQHNDFSECFITPVKTDYSYLLNSSKEDFRKKINKTQKRFVRKIASMLFLSPHEWKEGDGGECAVSDKDGKVFSRAIPHFNTLFSFETVPNSFHYFMGGNKFRRDTLIWWMHQEFNDVLKSDQNKVSHWTKEWNKKMFDTRS